MFFNEESFESALEQMTNTSMFAVEPLGKSPIEVLHASGQSGIGCLNHQMVMIVHQTVAVTTPIKFIGYFAEDKQKLITILIRGKNCPACVATGSDVVKSAWKFDAQWSCHTHLS